MHLSSQIKLSKKKIVTVLGISFFLISLIVLLNVWKGIPFGFLTRDITAIAEVPFYTGFLSQIGFIIWIVTATICLFSAHISRRLNENRSFSKFIQLSGLLSIFLCFDDMFLLHEQVFPMIFGMSEKVVYILYAGSILYLLIKYYLIIIETEFILLAMALVCFGLSIGTDIFHISFISSYLLEDGLKVTGIISWFYYYYSNALILVSGSARSNRK